MKFGLPISLMLHAAILGAGAIGWQSAADTDDDFRIIPVKIYTVSDVTNVRPADKTPEPTKKPAAEPVVQTPEPVAEVSEEAPQSDIAAASAEIPDIKAPIPVTKADLEPQIDAKPKPLSLDDLSAMVAQSKDKVSGDVRSEQKLLESERNRIEQADLARHAQGLGTGMTTAYEDAIMRRIYNSWRIPSGAPDLESLIVTLTVTLDRDGKVTTVALSPDSERRVKSDSYYRTSAESALRAVRDAKEFKFLPRADYERWRNLTLTFHPKDAPTGVPT